MPYRKYSRERVYFGRNTEIAHAVEPLCNFIYIETKGIFYAKELYTERLGLKRNNTITIIIDIFDIRCT